MVWSGFAGEQRLFIQWRKREVVNNSPRIQWLSHSVGFARIIRQLPRSVCAKVMRSVVKRDNIQFGGKRIVLRGIILRMDQNTISLRRRDPKRFNFLGFSVHAVDLDDGHVVVFEVKEDLREGRHVDYAEVVGLARLHRE